MAPALSKGYWMLSGIGAFLLVGGGLCAQLAPIVRYKRERVRGSALHEKSLLLRFAQTPIATRSQELVMCMGLILTVAGTVVGVSLAEGEFRLPWLITPLAARIFTLAWVLLSLAITGTLIYLLHSLSKGRGRGVQSMFGREWDRKA